MDERKITKNFTGYVLRESQKQIKSEKSVKFLPFLLAYKTCKALLIK